MKIKLAFDSFITLQIIFSQCILSQNYSVSEEKNILHVYRFPKAFNSQWRVGLRQKLLKSNINGKFLTLFRTLP